MVHVYESEWRRLVLFYAYALFLTTSKDLGLIRDHGSFSGFQGTYAHNSYAAADDWKHTDFAIATGETALPTRYKVGDELGNLLAKLYFDPCVFYDDNDNLWMSYGSWSGGIFMIKLDKTNGLRDYTYTFPYEVNGRPPLRVQPVPTVPATLTSARRLRVDIMYRVRQAIFRRLASTTSSS